MDHHYPEDILVFYQGRMRQKAVPEDALHLRSIELPTCALFGIQLMYQKFHQSIFSTAYLLKYRMIKCAKAW